MCWKTLLNIIAISCSQASYDARRSLPAGLAAGLPSSPGRHGAELDSGPEHWGNEVLLAAASCAARGAEEEPARPGARGGCRQHHSAGPQEEAPRGTAQRAGGCIAETFPSGCLSFFGASPSVFIRGRKSSLEQKDHGGLSVAQKSQGGGSGNLICSRGLASGAGCIIHLATLKPWSKSRASKYALGIVLLPSSFRGEPRSEPGHKQEGEMEHYRANQTQGALYSVPHCPGAWPGTGPAALLFGWVQKQRLMAQLSPVPVELFPEHTQ